MPFKHLLQRCLKGQVNVFLNIIDLPMCTVYGTIMNKITKILPAIFFQTLSGNEPVREWLKGLDKENRIIIGQDIKTVEFGWPKLSIPGQPGQLYHAWLPDIDR